MCMPILDLIISSNKLVKKTYGSYINWALEKSPQLIRQCASELCDVKKHFNDNLREYRSWGLMGAY